MTRPLVYVAGPITGDPWGCVRRATDVAAFLADQDMNAYLPQLSVLHEIVAPEPYEHWLRLGLDMLERVDGVLRLTGESPGADSEVAHAEDLGLPVLTCDSPRRHWPFSEPQRRWLDDVRRQWEARRHEHADMVEAGLWMCVKHERTTHYIERTSGPCGEGWSGCVWHRLYWEPRR